MKDMKKYFDTESQTVLTELDLLKEFCENNGTCVEVKDGKATFEYDKKEFRLWMADCCGKNGTLIEIVKEK